MTSAEVDPSLDRSALPGTGIAVVVIDSGVERIERLGPRARQAGSLATDPRHRSSHGMRIASLIAEGHDTPGAVDQPVGLAPGVDLTACSFEDLDDGNAAALVRSLELTAPIVAVHPYSSRLGPDETVRRQAAWTAAAGAHTALHLAAAGHDGPGVVRYPASLVDVLAVGVLDDDGLPVARCGSSEALRKPELWVVDEARPARLEDGSVGTIDGTSGAVAVAGAAAAAWAHRSGTRSAVELRAILLAATEAIGGRRCVRFPPTDPTDGLHFGTADPTDVIRVTATGSVTVCFVASPPARLPSRWLPRAPQWRVAAGQLDAPTDAVAGWWIVDDLEDSTVEVSVRGSTGSIGWAVVPDGEAEVVVEVERRRRRTKQHRDVIGISASHDASAVALRNGSIHSGVQLERLTRRKHDGGACLDDPAAVDYVLDALDVGPEDIARFGFNTQSLVPGYVGLSRPVRSARFTTFDPYGSQTTYVSHHLAHAAGAFAASRFDTAVVFVADGSGGTTVGADDLVLDGPGLLAYASSEAGDRMRHHSCSAYLMSNCSATLLWHEDAPSFNTRAGSSSLGEAYAATAEFVFGDWVDGSGKLMGLAPYGDAERFGPTLLVDEPPRFSHAWKLDAGAGPGVDAGAATQDPIGRADLAARVQDDLSTALLARIQAVRSSVDETRLVVTGGLALNAVANQRIAEHVGPHNVFFLPASSDAGIALGAAALAERALTGELPCWDPWDDAIGYRYEPADIEAALAVHAEALDIAPFDPTQVAALVTGGSFVAWFDGGSEFGPRALGHRSILADARHRSSWERLNRGVKYREDFRPFAPVVTAEDASTYFDIGDSPSPYMLRVVPVRARHQRSLAAVTHVDGTARVQTVSRHMNPRLHAVLERVGLATGIPVAVNTSLNASGQPIVETPLEAVELFLSCGLDALVIGDKLVRRAIDPIPDDGDVGVVLAPGCHLERTSDHLSTRTRLVSRTQNNSFDIAEPVAESIAKTQGGLDLPAALRQTGLGPTVPAVLDALVAQRLLVVNRRRASALSSDRSSGRTSGRTSAVAAATPTWSRSAGAAEVVTRVMSRRVALGITRVAEWTGFDDVGIPVVGATRPSVDSAQITACQAAGIDLDQAKAAALMEVVERHALARMPSGARTATEAELRVEGHELLGAAELGGSRVDGLAAWVEGHRLLTGDPVWMPASRVVFPYYAPAGLIRPTRPHTSGAAAGSTLGEAIGHGLVECVERATVSAYQLGARATSLPSGHLSEATTLLLASFDEAGVRVVLADLSHDALLPTVVCHTLGIEYQTAGLVVSGQGSAPTLDAAVRSALLEAAQSRIVAIMASREDLHRHADRWKSAHAEARDHLDHLAAHLDAPVEPRATITVGALAEHLAELGQEPVVFDLTVDDIDIPVSRVVVPGLVDRVARER